MVSSRPCRQTFNLNPGLLGPGPGHFPPYMVPLLYTSRKVDDFAGECLFSWYIPQKSTLLSVWAVSVFRSCLTSSGSYSAGSRAVGVWTCVTTLSRPG